MPRPLSYRAGNILALAVLIAGINALVYGALLAGALFSGAAVLASPAFRRYGVYIPSHYAFPVAAILFVAGLTVLA